MKINKFYLVLALFAGTAVLSAFVIRGKRSSLDESVKWLSFDEAMEMAQKDPKPLMIDVYTDWCGWCKKMDKDTFKDSETAAYINKNFYAVKLDAESDERITHKGKKISKMQLAGQVFGVRGYPTVVFYNVKKDKITPQSGYMKPEQFRKLLDRILENQ